MSKKKRKSHARSYKKIAVANGSDRDFFKGNNFVFSFGAYGSTRVRVYEKSLESALDEAIDWLADNAKGHIVDDQVTEAYNEAIAAGKSESAAIEEAESDTTIGGNNGHHILSYEWSVTENPSRADILDMEERPKEHRAMGVDKLAKKRRRSNTRRSVR